MLEDNEPTFPVSFEDCRGRVKIMLESFGFNLWEKETNKKRDVFVMRIFLQVVPVYRGKNLRHLIQLDFCFFF